jgi:hypothetical protein
MTCDVKTAPDMTMRNNTAATLSVPNLALFSVIKVNNRLYKTTLDARQSIPSLPPQISTQIAAAQRLMLEL